MGDKNNKRARLRESQRDNANAKKTQWVITRRFILEYDRQAKRLRFEAEREYLALCALVFLLGLFVLFGVSVYYIGGAIYG